jgi:hypothetical protein
LNTKAQSVEGELWAFRLKMRDELVKDGQKYRYFLGFEKCFEPRKGVIS